MRLFLAIELPHGIRTHLAAVRARLEAALPGVAYTKTQNLHMTLKFLGDVDKGKLNALVESLAHIRTPSMEFQASGIDCFPARGPIRIITAEVAGTLPPLLALVKAIEQRCGYLGFQKEQRGYRPHITLARARPVLSAKFRALLEESTRDAWPGVLFAPSEFVLMESQLSPAGSKYSVVARFPIDG